MEAKRPNLYVEVHQHPTPNPNPQTMSPPNRKERVSVRKGYDLWSVTYESTPNPVVTMDSRHTIKILAPAEGELILDAGCGTGRNLKPLLTAGATAIGID